MPTQQRDDPQIGSKAPVQILAATLALVPTLYLLSYAPAHRVLNGPDTLLLVMHPGPSQIHPEFYRAAEWATYRDPTGFLSAWASLWNVEYGTIRRERNAEFEKAFFQAMKAGAESLREW